jgi:hypothetical protein
MGFFFWIISSSTNLNEKNHFRDFWDLQNLASSPHLVNSAPGFSLHSYNNSQHCSGSQQTNIFAGRGIRQFLDGGISLLRRSVELSLRLYTFKILNLPPRNAFHISGKSCMLQEERDGMRPPPDGNVGNSSGRQVDSARGAVCRALIGHQSSSGKGSMTASYSPVRSCWFKERRALFLHFNFPHPAFHPDIWVTSDILVWFLNHCYQEAERDEFRESSKALTSKLCKLGTFCVEKKRNPIVILVQEYGLQVESISQL